METFQLKPHSLFKILSIIIIVFGYLLVLQKVRESVDRVLSESEQLEHSDPTATEKLRDQTRAISTLCDEFMNRLDERKRTLQATLDFYNNHDLVS